ncbi:MAG: hypothetical protein ACI9GM_000087 [Salibacteraceae bacterium]|jgi:hypothetical protein
MNARFFYGAPIFSNSPKLLVLTEDGVLYSEIREYEVTTVDKIDNVAYSNFVEKNFENEDYPILLEIEYPEARDMPLAGQANWIDRYVNSKNINVEMALQA